jgi:hypothetical protein
MNVDTMEELGLTSMTTTPIILRMADQSRVKPLGMLSQLLTTIGGISPIFLDIVRKPQWLQSNA